MYLYSMKIYTKKGDTGETSLIGGTRVAKYHIRVEAYGTVDELNVCIGLVADQPIAEKYKNILRQIQFTLFTVGASLASDPDTSNMVIPDLNEPDIAMLENEIDQMESELTPLKNFILPGGHTTVSYCHLARVVCRRAERTVTSLADTSEIHPLVIKFLNRLSDYLFVLARKLSKDLNVPEIEWKPRG